MEHVQLSDEQRAAAENEAQFSQIIAGPGTGKTSTIAHSVAHRIENGTPPERILALSFTNDACNAMRSHLNRTIGEKCLNVDVFTFHSFSHHILNVAAEHLQEPKLQVVDEWDIVPLLRGLRPFTTKQLRIAPYDQLIEMNAFKIYRKRLRDQGVRDYRCLLLDAREVVGNYAEYDHVYVDEFQDTNEDQFNILHQLIKSNPHMRVTVIGDPNQSIFGFDQEVEFDPFEAYKQFKPVSLNLSVNYRSTPSLVKFFNVEMPCKYPQVSKRTDDGDKPTLAICESGTHHGFSNSVTAAVTSSINTALEKFKRATVLVYTNEQVRNIAQLLGNHNIAFEVAFNKVVFKPKSSKLVIHLFRYALYQRNYNLMAVLDGVPKLFTYTMRKRLSELTDEFKRPILPQLRESTRYKNKRELIAEYGEILEDVVRKLQVAKTIEMVRYAVSQFIEATPDIWWDENIERLFDAIEFQSRHFDTDLPLVYQFMNATGFYESCDNILETKAVQIRTIHSAKGLEWPAVVMPYLGADNVPFFGKDNKIYPKAIYVGMTRARDHLSMISTSWTSIESNPHVNILGRSAMAPLKERYPRVFGALKFNRCFHMLRVIL